MSKIKERPILFNAEMVRAILNGSKTQTRRPVKPQPPEGVVWYGGDGRDLTHDGEPCFTFMPEADSHPDDWQILRSPYGAPGDRLIPAILIEGYDVRYCADVFGHIWSKSSGEWRRMRSNETAGYQRLTLRLGGQDVNRTVHGLVCRAYYGDPSEGMVVRHLNGDSQNNAPENLDWGTYSQNWADRKAHGNGVGCDHHNAKITMADAEAMRASGKTAWALSKEYPLSPKSIANILSGKTWILKPEQPAPNMPRWASRLTLEVTEVRVERVEEITPGDCLEEGLEPCYPDAAHGDPIGFAADGLVANYLDLYESIYGTREGWAWAISFRVIPQGEVQS